MPGATRVARLLDRTGLVVFIGIGFALGAGYVAFGVRPTDPATFWDAGQQAHHYGATWTVDAGYVYPPVLAQVLGPVPWPVFLVPWTVLVFGCLWYALRWLALPVLGLALAAWAVSGGPNPASEPIASAAIGNPQAIIAALLVAGARHPAAWAGVLLTKIGPGIGLLWFAFRGDWRTVGLAVSITAAVAGISFVLAPGAWTDFAAFAVANHSTEPPIPVVPVPLWVRLPMAMALLWWGARTDRYWTVLVASGWAALALYSWSFLPLWLTALRLAAEDIARARVEAPLHDGISDVVRGPGTSSD